MIPYAPEVKISRRPLTAARLASDLLVELVGFEPTSRQGSERLSTCLALFYFRQYDCPEQAIVPLSSCRVG